MSTTAFDTAITQARDLLRWRSPLRTELWAARLTAELEASGQDDVPGRVAAFLRRLAEDGSPEARLTLAALAAVNGPTEATSPGDATRGPGAVSDRTDGGGGSVGVPRDPGDHGDPAGVLRDLDDEWRDMRSAARPYTAAGQGVLESLPGWVRRMGRTVCDGGWYGKADPYGEQALAVLSFRYENGKEPHILVVGIDQPSGGLAVDALVEEPKFLDELDLRPEVPETVAARVLEAIERTDRVMGAQVADTLPAVRPFALTRAHSVRAHAHPAHDHAQPAEEGLLPSLPDVPGAREAFEKLLEFVGDRPLWWSPSRASQFLTQWLPREAILSDEAIAAMPDVVRAWTRHQGGHPAVLRQIDADAPGLPLLMADDRLASLNKRLARRR